MIVSFRHKGLQALFERGSKKGIQPAHAVKLQLLLTALDAAEVAERMNQPGWDFHSLHPPRDLVYAVKVNGNWRLTFRFFDGNAEIVDYRDYH